MQFSSLGSSKMELSKTDFFDTLTIQNDQISYAKHVLAPLYVFFTIFGCWGARGGLPRGLGHNLLMQLSSLSSSRMVVPLPSSRCRAEGNRITLQRLLDQSQAGVYRGKSYIPPILGLFWAYSRTLPQGVELSV